MKSNIFYGIPNACVVSVCAVLLAGPAIAAPAFAETAAPVQLPNAGLSLQNAEDQFLRAEVDHDIDAIANGLADEVHYVHAMGNIQTKSDFVQSFKNGGAPFKSIVMTDRVVKVMGEAGVTRGTMNIVVGDMHLTGLYLGVYVMRDGRWQLIDWQTTDVPKTRESH